jgi:hypothetical protein
VVIRKEFERAVQRNARFWRSPATSVQAGPGVLKVDVAGLDTLLQGGVQFDVFGAGRRDRGRGGVELFANERAARSVRCLSGLLLKMVRGYLPGRRSRCRGVPVGLVEEVNPSEAKWRSWPAWNLLRHPAAEGTIFSWSARISLERVWLSRL